MHSERHWIDRQISFEGEFVKLAPLHESHFEQLLEIARDQSIWEHYPYAMSSAENVRKQLSIALDERDAGNQVPFVIYDKGLNKLIGSTRFLDVQPKNEKLEIGWTWLAPEYWGTIVNIECKLLLLTFCFETAKARRVQFRTDANNTRSRKAIEKIGGKFEGVLRRDWIRYNGVSRDTAYYSILESEWSDVKKHLEALREKLKTDTIHKQ